MSLNHPLFFDTQCRLYMPSTILGKYNPFATAYIEYTCRGTITKEEIKIDQALKEWEKVRFFYNCILTCSHKTLKQNEYDYLCSQDFKELCNCFNKNRIYNRLLLNILYVINQKYGLNL